MRSMNQELAGQIAIVTGAAKGIGLAIAKTLGEHGAHVYLWDILEDELNHAKKTLDHLGIKNDTMTVNVTEETEVKQAMESIGQQHGKIDILVNNAGIIRDQLLFKMSLLDWEQVMDVHLKGAFLCSHYAQTWMVKQKYGRIINLSSTSALGNRGQANYAAAKAGIQGFTKTLAIELGPFHITANAIAPGFIETDMTKSVADRIGISYEELKQEKIKQIPVRRIGQPEDIAHAALFFALPASSYISGQVLYVAGGPTV